MNDAVTPTSTSTSSLTSTTSPTSRIDAIPQRAQELFDRYRASNRAWKLTIASVFLAEAVMLAWVGRNQWYFFDEWRLVVERVIQLPGQEHGLFKRLFLPDGEHVIALPLALFILLTNAAGLGTYAPFIVANIIVRLATLWLADDIIRRLGGRRAARLVVMISIAFFGAGFESLFGQSLIFAGFTLVFCLLAIRETLKPTRSESLRGGIAAAYLVGAIFSSSYGFPVVIGTALLFLFGRRRIAAAIALVVPPVAFLVVRALAGGAYAQQQPVQLSRVPLYIDYIQNGVGSVGEAILGLDNLGLAAYLILVVGCIWFGRGRQQAWFGLAMVCSVVAFYGVASISRSVFGADQAVSPRYLFFCGVLTLIMLGAAWGNRRLELRGAIVVGLLLLVSFSNSLGRLIEGKDYYVSKMELSEGRLRVGFAAATESGFDAFTPDPQWAPDLYLSRLDAVLDWSGSADLIAEGTRCYNERLAELDDAGFDTELLDARNRVALVLMLNEHSLGVYGENERTISYLIEAGSTGSTGNPVVDQFADAYATIGNVFPQSDLVPSAARCD